MTTRTTTRRLSLAQSEIEIAKGAVFVDLREVPDHLDVHVRGSLCLEYEFGPGLPGRARDCVPLNVPFVLLEREDVDMDHVAAGFRGKGFAVAGMVEGGVQAWGEGHGSLASTEVYEGRDAPEGLVLDIGDPGVRVLKGSRFIPIEQLWGPASELAGEDPVIVTAGRGLRAALAIGMLERAGVEAPIFWWTSGRRVTTIPATAVVKR